MLHERDSNWLRRNVFGAQEKYSLQIFMMEGLRIDSDMCKEHFL